MELNPSFRRRQSLSYSRISQHFIELPRYITMFIRAFYWPLSCAKWIQFIPPDPISLRCILILSSHLCVGLPSGLFWLSHQNPICILILPRACYMPCSSHSSCYKRGSKSLECTQREISGPVVHLLASVLRGWLVICWEWESLWKQNFLVNWISTNLSTFRPLCTIGRYTNTARSASASVCSAAITKYTERVFILLIK
jgi:hypothetical protein